MKVHRHYVNDRCIDAYYDRSERVWCAFAVDPDGNQCRPAVYAVTKAEAVLLASVDQSGLYRPNPFYSVR